MDRDQDTGDVIHNSRRSAGGSLWSGLKQIFHNKSPGQPTPPEASINSRPRRLEHSSFSYSCLGNSNSRKVEDDMYGDSGSGMASQSSLSRNISYSHESVFQMDPPNNIPPVTKSSPKLRNTSSTVVLPSLVHTELLSVLAERHYGGTQPMHVSKHRHVHRKTGSDGCLTDEEDLGLPASIQNSPGDYTRSRSLYSSKHPSRHHSSCSDNSLLSLDSDHQITDSGAESLGSCPPAPGLAVGLSHQAARHKMAIRPKRNHAITKHRKLQQLVEEPVIEEKPSASTTESRLSEFSSPNARDRSKSLDKMFREVSPNADTMRDMASKDDFVNKNNSKHKQKDQEGNFLSRLFGSKRLRLRTSVSKKDLTEEKRKTTSQSSSSLTQSPPVLSKEAPSMDQHHPVEPVYHQAETNQISPTRLKHNPKLKPPPPPPPDSNPPDYHPPPVYHHPHYYHQPQDHHSHHPGVPVLPPLPSNKSDIILKKNTSLGAIQFADEKFHASVQNWSYANEGRVKSMVSLSGGENTTTQSQTQSNESLATISSLLEEPELLEHTSITEDLDDDLEKSKPQQKSTIEDVFLEPSGNNDDYYVDNGIAFKEVQSIANNTVNAQSNDKKDECEPYYKNVSEAFTDNDQSTKNDPITKVDNEEQSSSSTLHQFKPRKSIIVDCVVENVTDVADNDNDDTSRDFNISAVPNKEMVENYKSKSGMISSNYADGQNSPTNLTIVAEHERVESEKFSEVNKLSSEETNKKPDYSHTTADAAMGVITALEEKIKDDENILCGKTDAAIDIITTKEVLQHLVKDDEVKTRHTDKDDEEKCKKLNMVKSESEKVSKDHIAATEKKCEKETTEIVSDNKFEQFNVRKKPEISPKPVPAPRTFFLPRPKPEAVGGTGSGITGTSSKEQENELLNVFARRSTSFSDVLEKTFVTESSTTGLKEISNTTGQDDSKSSEVEINVKERAKSFTGLQTYQLGPKPFRPVSSSTEKEPERQKPAIAQKPIPAPRQFRSFSKLPDFASNEDYKVLKTTKSTSSVVDKINPTKKMTDVESSQIIQDNDNLDDIQVRKIADKFQKQTPPKPVRKTSSSSPIKQEDDNNKKNVLNIVTKINSMAIL